MAGARPAARWRALTAAGALLLAGLAGCTGDAAPSPPPLETSTSSPSPSEATGSPAPTLPPEASGTTAASAKAFVRYFFRTVNHALVTGDSAPLRSASTPACRTCRQMINRTERLYENGGRIRSTGWEIAGIARINDATTRNIFMVGIDFPAEVVLQPGEDEIRRKPSQGSFTLFLIESSRGWLVNRMDLAQ